MADFNINNTALGKKSSTPDSYDASLLFRIPRAENRERYEIHNSSLLFTGVDVWNCYEISFLTNNGLPVSRMMKVIYACESEFLVESKSLKLYLNSFNMEKLGKTIQDAESAFIGKVKIDLEKLLETEVSVVLFQSTFDEEMPFVDLIKHNLIDLIPEKDVLNTVFDRYIESPDMLNGTKTSNVHVYSFRTDVMRSNCRVTNQPDWGDLFVRIKSTYEIDLLSVLAYLISFRRENHFHEEVVEMIYKRLWDKFEPEELLVAAMYTRRGGIDINPLRVSSPALIDRAFVQTNKRLAKTLRQ